MNHLQKVLLLLCLPLLSCGQPPRSLTGGEICPNDACDEAEINAPVEGSREDPGYDSTEHPYREYAIPAFQESWGLRRALFDRALEYYRSNGKTIRNTRYITIIDFTMKSVEKRLYLLDMETGQVKRHLVAHGKNSDPDQDFLPTEFSNVIGSYKSSLGFYLTLGTYQGKNGYSMRIRGLEKTNDNAETRAIVVHSAKYVNDAKGEAGTSLGCPAVDPLFSTELINQIKGESLLYIGV
jgi:hypothetical protein